MVRRPGISLAAVTVALSLVGCVVATSRSYDDCDYVIRRCRTVCDYWCDAYGCWPSCWDDCWNECGYYPSAPPSTTTPPANDAGEAGAAPDGGTQPEGGAGVLCSPCASNDQCQKDALCIRPGGDAGGAASFCSHPCTVPGDCPEGFACSQIGASSQCLPKSGRCE